jgi:hypothetical protein
MLGCFRGHPRLAKLIRNKDRFIPGLANSVDPTAGKLGRADRFFPAVSLRSAPSGSPTPQRPEQLFAVRKAQLSEALVEMRGDRRESCPASLARPRRLATERKRHLLSRERPIKILPSCHASARRDSFDRRVRAKAP